MHYMSQITVLGEQMQIIQKLVDSLLARQEKNATNFGKY